MDKQVDPTQSADAMSPLVTCSQGDLAGPPLPASADMSGQGSDKDTSGLASHTKRPIPADVLSITSSIKNDFEFTSQDRNIDRVEGDDSHAEVVAGGYLQFQLIPFTDDPNSKFPLEEVVDRKLRDGDAFKIGRLSSKDAYKKGIPSLDAWFTSKVVSRIHAEIWLKDGQLFIRDVGSSSGTFLNKTRLSPSGKESRPYPLKEGDILQLGVDFKDKNDHFFKSVSMKCACYDQAWVQSSRKKANPVRFQAALRELLKSSNPHAKDPSSDGTATDCCICLGETAPFQALFIAPCSHCYHYKCVMNILQKSSMFQCPLCRQVANLTASVSVEDVSKVDKLKPSDTASLLSFGSGGYGSPRAPSIKSSDRLDGMSNDAQSFLTHNCVTATQSNPGVSYTSPTTSHRRNLSGTHSFAHQALTATSPHSPYDPSTSGNSATPLAENISPVGTPNTKEKKKSFSQKISTFLKMGSKGSSSSQVVSPSTSGQTPQPKSSTSPSGSSHSLPPPPMASPNQHRRMPSNNSLQQLTGKSSNRGD